MKFRDSQDKALCPQPPPAPLPWQPASLGTGRAGGLFVPGLSAPQSDSMSRKPLKTGEGPATLLPTAGVGRPRWSASSRGLSVCLPLSPPVFGPSVWSTDTASSSLQTPKGQEAAGQPPGRNLCAQMSSVSLGRRPGWSLVFWKAASHGLSSSCTGLFLGTCRAGRGLSVKSDLQVPPSQSSFCFTTRAPQLSSDWGFLYSLVLC